VIAQPYLVTLCMRAPLDRVKSASSPWREELQDARVEEWGSEVLVHCVRDAAELHRVRELASAQIDGATVCYSMEVAFPQVDPENCSGDYLVWDMPTDAMIVQADPFDGFIKASVCGVCAAVFWHQAEPFHFTELPIAPITRALNNAILVDDLLAKKLSQAGIPLMDVPGHAKYRQLPFAASFMPKEMEPLPLGAQYVCGSTCRACGLSREYREPYHVGGPLPKDRTGKGLTVLLDGTPICTNISDFPGGFALISQQPFGLYPESDCPESMFLPIIMRKDIALIIHRACPDSLWRSVCFV